MDQKNSYIFDGNPQTYIDWAVDYFEIGSENEEDEGLVKTRINKTVSEIYEGKKLTKEMVLLLDKNFDDWKRLEEDLMDIAYNYDFK